MAKYETNRDNNRQQERVVASWSERPYTAYDKRSWAIEHRIVVEAHPGAGVDVRHEVRSDDADGVSAEWTEAEVYEAREHGLDKITRAEGEEWWA
jgi:hypothetical protein